MVYSIISFQRAHATAIAQVMHQAVQHIHHVRYPQAKLDAWSKQPRSTEYWRRQCVNGPSWVIVDCDQQVCGFISCDKPSRQQCHVAHLYIDPSHQRKQLATLLVKHLQAWAKTQPLNAITVDASHLSKGVFSQCGFVVTMKSIQRKRSQSLNGFYMTYQMPEDEKAQ
ncbi:GNAT family N-acetyltransferase [Shewanella maritima]|uniref:GNAT family N-acetyltransferase n=1 Tax=Shewanella maritima TaxID=2520507 RepID=UPI00373541B1